MALRITWVRQAVACLLALPCLALLATDGFDALLKSMDADDTQVMPHVITSLDNVVDDQLSVLRVVATYMVYIGDASFALTGAVVAGREGMCVFGCVVVGFITALGGGSLRDLTMGRLPLFWMLNWDELVLCVIVAVVAFFLWPRLSYAFGLDGSDEWLFWTDTVGLGAFATLGAYSAMLVEPRVHFGACAIAGMFSATFGGLMRDVLCQRPPRILFAAQEVYALPALAGGAATTAVMRLWSPRMVAEGVTLGFWVTIELRVLAVNHDIRLPTFKKEKVERAPSRKVTFQEEEKGDPADDDIEAFDVADDASDPGQVGVSSIEPLQACMRSKSSRSLKLSSKSSRSTWETSSTKSCPTCTWSSVLLV